MDKYQEVIEILKRLLVEAESGIVTGIAIIAQRYDGSIGTEWTGNVFPLITGTVALQARMTYSAARGEEVSRETTGPNRRFYQ
jgi:hypothetical protein